MSGGGKGSELEFSMVVYLRGMRLISSGVSDRRTWRASSRVTSRVMMPELLLVLRGLDSATSTSKEVASGVFQISLARFTYNSDHSLSTLVVACEPHMDLGR